MAVTKHNAKDLLAGYKCTPNGQTIITVGADSAVVNVLLQENGGGAGDGRQGRGWRGGVE